MASKISKKEWVALYAITGIIDLIQILGDLLLTEAYAAPEIISAAADPVIGTLIGGYFQFRGVDMIHQPKRILSLVGIGGLDELTGGIASFWVVDIWYIHRTVKMEEAQLKNQRAQEISVMRQQYNENGRRASEMERSKVNTVAETPLNTGNSRRPSSV